MDFAESPANVPNIKNGIMNRMIINTTSGRCGAKQRATEHKNPSITDGETQETGEIANVWSPAG